MQLDDGQLAIQLAREPADIARAREQFKAAAWRAEREFPHRWGAKQQIEHTFTDLGDKLDRAARRVIDVTPEPVVAPLTHAALPQIGDKQV